MLPYLTFMKVLMTSLATSLFLPRLATEPPPPPPPPFWRPVPFPPVKEGYLSQEARKSAGCPPFSGGTKARPAYQAPTRNIAALGRSLPGGGVWKYWWLSARVMVA